MLFTPEDRRDGAPEREMRLAREEGRASDERWHLRRDGSRFYASGICAPLLDANAHGYVKLLRDLTEQKLAQQRREELLERERASRESAEEASRMKDEFLATLSHELRNPLALIQMQAEILLRSPELKQNPRLASASEVIHQMVRTQVQFVEDMLDVSRLRTGKLTIERQLLPLPLIIADSIGALRDEAERSNITLDLQVTQDPLIVEADAVRVKQIAWNLLSNAFKFTPRGGHVKVSLRREADEARLDVEDTGQGIPKELLPHIFEWFRQGEAGLTRRKGGMGIGLALVRQLVDLHGGRVEAHSPGPGRGSRFTVWLPLQQAADSRSYSPPVAPVDNEERLTGARVLIIDDAPANADALRQLLQLEGADAQIATTAHEALARAQMQQFDVIISDLAMPEVDGHALLGQLRATPLNAKTPAVAYSGYGGPEDVPRSRAAGFDVHVTKPADLNRLVETINELRNRRERTAPR
jgi:two-component system CheB/CheR fusion protein